MAGLLADAGMVRYKLLRRSRLEEEVTVPMFSVSVRETSIPSDSASVELCRVVE